MRRLSALIQVVSAVTLGLIMPLQFVAQAQHGNPTATSPILGAIHPTINAWLKEEVANSNGQWDAYRYSFYIGISTSGIGYDPDLAKAMKLLATSLVNNSMAVDDKATAVAFEMQVYKTGETIRLTSNSASRAHFIDTLRTTSKPESKGGHDIEEALYEIVSKIPPPERACSIILLLNKDNTSQDPRGMQTGLFSEDNPKLQNAIRDGHFRHALLRTDFPVKVDSTTASVAITALFPSKLASLDYGKKTPRYPTFAPRHLAATG